MEPKSVNDVVEELEVLKDEIEAEFANGVPVRVKSMFSDTSLYFKDYILGEWRLQNRFDDLIEYIIYMYPDGGGDELWSQVLLDLSLAKDETRAIELLEGLYKGRAEKFWISVKQAKKYPDNYLCKVEVAKKKGVVMKVLYEHAYILENKQAEDRDLVQIEALKAKIMMILNEAKGG